MKTKLVHYFCRELTVFEYKGAAACGTYVNSKMFVGDRGTTNRKKVTCKNCKRTHLFRKTKYQQKCNKCKRIVGCDYRGRKHKCDCSRGK